ncbi:HEPN domain-containing protein [Exiguobacterium sp. BRG2]|uniref:HEPN domain-containing protein n=1 Tax=Exiguobacterium sp. BRG2 TaxID=2962584 RepID=UPI002881B182|nr:HEPN domain-containing protein [Exiguobacterium sp. BRG2]MDT0173090.1 HEPN domain-containing protein [Exiguobacterium sp. BRG2]
MSDKNFNCEMEYLLIVDSKNNFCSDKSSFNSLLLCNSDISIDDAGEISFKQLKISYKVDIRPLNQEKSNTQNVINTSFTCVDINQIEKFRMFNKIIKTTFRKFSEDLYVLKDDITSYYSEKAYPKIHEIENLMRKLINKFMILNVGVKWTDNYIPNGLKSSNKTTDYLFNLNIDQLSNILFDEYSPHSVEDLLEEIKSAKSIDSFSLEGLKKYVKKSNWERIFSNRVNFQGEFLQNRWESISKTRNIIAHNKSITVDEYEILLKNIREVKEKLESSILILDEINITEEEKKTISQHLVLEDSIFSNNIHPDPNDHLKSELKSNFQFMESMIINLIENNLKSNFDYSEIQKMMIPILGSHESRIDYLEKNIDFLPSNLLVDIKITSEALSKMNDLESSVPKQSFIKFLKNYIMIINNINTYLISVNIANE